MPPPESDWEKDRRAGYCHYVIPLMELNIDAAVAMLDNYKPPEGDKDADIREVFRIMLYFLRDIRDLSVWEGRNNTAVGFIKDTHSKGNTSVSYGVFQNLKKKPALFLNCGGGGIKWQYYAFAKTEDGNHDIVVIKECKGNQAKKLAHPSSWDKAITDAEIHAANQELQAEKKWVCNKFQIEETVTTVAFVTGDRRNAWEQTSDANTRLQMERQLQWYFFRVAQDVDLQENAYFLPQTKEGEFEFRAGESMYENLVQENWLPPMKLRRATGMGRTSTQDVFCNPKNSWTLRQFNATIGMNQIQKLQSELLPQWKSSFFSNLSREYSDHNVWDLMMFKSGFLIFLCEREEGKPFWEVLSSSAAAHRITTRDFLQAHFSIHTDLLSMKKDLVKNDLVLKLVEQLQTQTQQLQQLHTQTLQTLRTQSEQIAMLSAQTRELQSSVQGLVEEREEEKEEILGENDPDQEEEHDPLDFMHKR